MKAGYVALVGKPNVGKSTLMNALVGEKLSIVSPKPQTTRQRLLGILSTSEYQILFLDTPGLIEPTYALQREMMKHAESALEDADCILVLVDPVNTAQQLQQIAEKVIIPFSAKPILLVLNKIDTIIAEKREMLEQQCRAVSGVRCFLTISATAGEKTQELLSCLVQYLPEHPPYYPDDILSDRTERFFVAEFIREKIFEQFYDEVPYATTVVIRDFRERTEGKTYISADIIVERDSQKKILIGKNGEAIKALGQAARATIEHFLGREIFLELHVVVRRKWRQNETMLKQFGYTVPTKP